MVAKTRILVVDDEASIVKILRKRLEQFGFEVSVAMDGQAALDKAREEHPALIILDIMLPILNGYEVCAKLKQDEAYKRIPIIMFTAKEESEHHLAGLMFGADAYIAKNCGSKVLLERIRTLLSN